MDYNLTYAAKDKDEFKELVNWMCGLDVPAATVSAPAPDGGYAEKGEFETRYIEVFGKRLRISGEDKAAGRTDREEIARLRLEDRGEDTGEEGEIVPAPDDDGAPTF
jgi:hypothetical protein